MRQKLENTNDAITHLRETTNIPACPTDAGPPGLGANLDVSTARLAARSVKASHVRDGWRASYGGNGSLIPMPPAAERSPSTFEPSAPGPIRVAACAQSQRRQNLSAMPS
jgi:hypothetical protein